MGVLDDIQSYGVVPVIATEDALAEGGLPIAEITFRTDAAVSAIGSIATQQDIADGNWTRITQNAREAVEAVASVRG